MKTIRFRDDGQDFLEWDIDSTGKILACRPFQGFVWCGARVVNHRTLKPGQHARIRISSIAGVRPLLHTIARIEVKGRARS